MNEIVEHNEEWYTVSEVGVIIRYLKGIYNELDNVSDSKLADIKYGCESKREINKILVDRMDWQMSKIDKEIDKLEDIVEAIEDKRTIEEAMDNLREKLYVNRLDKGVEIVKDGNGILIKCCHERDIEIGYLLDLNRIWQGFHLNLTEPDES